MAKGDNIKKYQFKKGQTGNPNGRPRKYTTVLKSQGYSYSEVLDTITVMLAMTQEELKDVFSHPAATVLEKTIASVIAKGILKGSTVAIDSLLDRVFGSPVATNKLLGANGESLQVPTYVVLDKATGDALGAIAKKGKGKSSDK